MHTAGNDLARALKWGGGYTGEKVMQVLLTLEDANVVNLDRWVWLDTGGGGGGIDIIESIVPRVL